MEVFSKIMEMVENTVEAAPMFIWYFFQNLIGFSIDGLT